MSSESRLSLSQLDPLPVLGPEGAVARRLDSYEARPEQLRMAEAVARAIATETHLMVEAGTGVGKSFAYLVPAILAATADPKKKVVVSTHTINLQEQLLNKDIPFLRSVMPNEFTAALVKGRSNYLSLRRLDVAHSKADTLLARLEDVDELAVIRRWADRTTDGSRSDLDFRPAGAVWEAVASDHANCLGKSCRRHDQCFYFKARRRMWTANILVVNHALFMSDLALRAAGANLLPNYDVVIFDEAHTLEAVAAEHLGLRLTNSQVDFLLTRLFNERTSKGLLVAQRLPEACHQVTRTRRMAEDFFDTVVEWQGTHGPSNGRVRKPPPIADTLGEELRKLSTAILEGAEDVDEPEDYIELESAAKRCSAMVASLGHWLTHEDPDNVYWVEIDAGTRRRVTLASAPLDVGPALRRNLFDRGPACILASATLCVSSPPSFTFVKSRLGLTRCETLQLGSPFDYPRQVTVHIPCDLPDPSSANAEFERRAIEAIRFYLGKTHGKALVLFTSHRMLSDAARALTPWCSERNIALYAQSDGLPRSKMVEAFKANVDSVIFGADSFWQGVDVPGEALSNVIIVRLPFSVPDHPLLEARLEDIQRRGGNRFLEYQVPEAIIRLKQGFGRLIRSKTDHGIVAILDPRVLTKPYGRQFLESLPHCPRVVEALGPAR
jgi:ATP-dependent DNA helicase DinG